MSRASAALTVLFVSIFVSAAVLAQAPQTTIGGLKVPYDSVKGHITKAAEQVPEATYAFKATSEVRSMGQIFGHIANANFMICASASGLKSPAAGDAEKLATKAEIQKALADSFVFCDKAWAAVAGPEGNAPVDLFGMKFTRLSAMAFNSTHEWEHYGNIVTYMRLKGMTPPSSQGGGGN